MKLTVEQEKELGAFPALLRALIEAELAAGNSVVEVGHSFPAPPAGAYFKLEKKVSTRARETGDGLNFYERNSSLYSGEFTDSKRFYFVLEPANPPPPEPDMDAIRRSLEPKPSAWVERGETRESPVRKTRTNPRPSKEPKREVSPTGGALSVTETEMGVIQELHFRDVRAPNEIQALIEQRVMTLFEVTVENGRWRGVAQVKEVGAPYSMELRFEAALSRTNCYSLRVETQWMGQSAENAEYYRKSSAGWFSFWTRDFQPGQPPQSGEGSVEDYQERCEKALKAEAHLNSVPAIQKAIVDAMKDGASFATSHKEGGSHIRWMHDRFIKSDYGDDPGHQSFADQGEFLKFLRQYYDWETSKHVYPNKVSDFVAWKLIFRLLRD